MTLKPNIFCGVPASEVIWKIPHVFRDVIDSQRLKDSTYTVIAFPGMRGSSTSIVDSRTLTKALAKAGGQERPLVVVAHNFTAEARDLLDERGALFFFKSDFFWSDESLRKIRSKS